MSNDILTMTEQDLAEILASVDDGADNHILWVSMAGTVHISPTGGQTPVGWAAANASSLQFRWETFDAGNDYCGGKAASDPDYVAETLRKLRADWQSGRKGYVDY